MATDPATWRPTVADIAALVAHRAGDRDGAAVASFSANSVPTASQVEALVSQVQAEVATRIGDVPTALATPVASNSGPGGTPAGRVVALGAASYVELQFWPDLQLGGQGPAQQLWERYQVALDALVAASADIADDGVLGSDPVMKPSYRFPDTASIGRATTHSEPF